MKRNLHALAAMALLAIVSCNKPSVDDPSGKYPEAKELKSLTLASCDVEKGESTRTFTITLSGEASVVFTLIGNSYYLTPDTYTAAEEAAAKKGNYVSGKTTVGGKNVISGSVIVSKSGDASAYAETDVYKIDAAVFTSDGTPYKILWEGSLEFEADDIPSGPVAMTEVVGVSNYYDMFKAWGMEVNMLGILLSDGSVKAQYDASTMSYTYAGTGPCLQLELYTKDGLLAPGTYAACKTAGSIAEGEFGIGYEKDGSPAGTVLSHYVNGVRESYEYITDGTVSVALEGKVFTITLTSSKLEASYSGEIEGLAGKEDDKPSEGMLKLSGLTLTKSVSKVYDASFQEVAGFQTFNMSLTDEDGSAVGNFGLVVADGTEEFAGEYTVKKNAAASFTAEAGADYSALGMGVIGCYYYKEGKLVLLPDDEKFTVTAGTDGTYTFTDGKTFEFSGKAPEEINPDMLKISGLTITKTIDPVRDASYQEVSGFKTYNFKLSQGEEVVAGFGLVVADGTTEVAGEYTVKKNAAASFTAEEGAELWGFTYGCYYYKEGTRIFIKADEKFTVTTSADGSYSFSDGKAYEFSGKIAE